MSRPFHIDDEVFLVETGLFHLNRYSGEVYLRGVPLDRWMDRGLERVARELLGGHYINVLRAVEQVTRLPRGFLDILGTVYMYNVVSPIHTIYIVARSAGYGLYNTVRNVYELSIPEACRAAHSRPLERELYGLPIRRPAWVEKVLRLLVEEGLLDREGAREMRRYLPVMYPGAGDPVLGLVARRVGVEAAASLYIVPKIIAAEAVYRESSPRGLVIPPYYSGPLLPRDASEEVSDE